MELKSSPKTACGRSVDPEETIRRLSDVIGRKYDYYTHEEKVADHLFWSVLYIEELGFRSMGKGVSESLSRAGALAEAAEWLTCQETTRLPGYCAARQDELQGEDILRIEDLLDHIATATPPVVERIKDLDDAHHWVDGYSLRDNRTIKVPIEYISLIGGPNGKAAGNTLEEAIEHAVLEIFERRAHITVLRNRLVMPTIDLDSITDPLLREQLEVIQGKGIEVTLKDLSFGGVLPCVGAYFEDPNIPPEYQFRHFFKVGSSFDRTEALMRTFTEYAQGRGKDEFIDGSRSEQERILRHDFRALPVMHDTGDNFLSSFMFGFVPYRDAQYLKAGEVVPFEAGTCSRDSLDDIRQALGVCEVLEKDFIVVDLTDPEIGFGVAQVIVPGYSDVLPFHPANSPGLFRRLTQPEVLRMYAPSHESNA